MLNRAVILFFFKKKIYLDYDTNLAFFTHLEVNGSYKKYPEDGQYHHILE